MKVRFMAAIALVALLMLLVQDVPLAFYMHQNEQNKVTGTLQRDALVIAGRSQTALWKSSASAVSALSGVAASYRKSGGARIVIVNGTGKAIVTSDDDQAKIGQNFSNRPEFAQALAGNIATGTRFSSTLNESLLYVAVPVFNGDIVIGAVRLTFPAQTVADAVNSQLWVLGLVALITVALAGIAGVILSRGVTRRLSALEAATQKLADGDLAVRADDEHGAPELRSLARSFNEMSARLDALLKLQKSFASDASHQLRTPLTALRLRLERASELIDTDPAGAAERLHAAERETDRLSNIIEGLLRLSRAEASNIPVATYDLAELARDRVEHWRALAHECSVDIAIDTPASAPVEAIPTAIEQIIDNFVDNALAVSPPGSAIAVSVLVDEKSVTLSVCDSGPGLRSDEYIRAFDRFWRASSETEGSGLGLAIVAQLAHASGAHAELRPALPHGVDARVRFLTPRA